MYRTNKSLLYLKIILNRYVYSWLSKCCEIELHYEKNKDWKSRIREKEEKEISFFLLLMRNDLDNEDNWGKDEVIWQNKYNVNYSFDFTTRHKNKKEKAFQHLEACIRYYINFPILHILYMSYFGLAA